jgi:O-antigen/teichoic acid export membrane protein
MAKLAAGSVLARAISIITVPILSRLYTPTDYGILSVYTSIIQILFPIMSLRYCVAIPLPKRDEIALAVFTLSALMIFGLTAVTGIALAYCGPALMKLLSADILAPWWWLVLIGLLMASLSELLNFWATRKRAYTLMAKNAFAIAMIGEILKVTLGAIGLRPFGLLLGQMVGQSGGVVNFTRHFSTDFLRIRTVVTPLRLRFALWHYRSYAYYRLPSQFLLAFSMHVPLLYTAKLYGVEVSGQLGLALMTLALPVNLIGQAMGKAYYAEIARLGRSRPKEILEITKVVQKKLFIMGAIPTLIIMFFGQDLFTMVFGSQWHDAGKYASILSIYMLLQFTSAPLMQLFNVFKQQGVFLIINITRATLIFLLIWIVGFFSMGAEEYVFLYGVIMTVFYTATTLYVFIMARKRDRM